MNAIEDWHFERLASRRRAEEERKNWPPIADRYDMGIRAQ